MNDQPHPHEHPAPDAGSPAHSTPPPLPPSDRVDLMESFPKSKVELSPLPLQASSVAASSESKKSPCVEHFGARFFFEIGEIFFPVTVLIGGFWFYGSKIKTFPSSVQTLAWWGPTLMLMVSLVATGALAWRYYQSGKSVSNWISGPLICMLLCGGLANMVPTLFTIMNAFDLGDRWGLGDLAIPVNLLWGGLVLIVCGLIQALALVISILSLLEFRKSNAKSV